MNLHAEKSVRPKVLGVPHNSPARMLRIMRDRRRCLRDKLRPAKGGQAISGQKGKGLGGIPPRPSEYKKRTAPPSCSLRAEPRTKVFFSF